MKTLAYCLYSLSMSACPISLSSEYLLINCMSENFGDVSGDRCIVYYPSPSINPFYLWPIFITFYFPHASSLWEHTLLNYSDGWPRICKDSDDILEGSIAKKPCRLKHPSSFFGPACLITDIYLCQCAREIGVLYQPLWMLSAYLDLLLIGFAQPWWGHVWKRIFHGLFLQSQFFHTT